MKKVLPALLLLVSFQLSAQTITPVLFPLYMQGHGTSTASDERRVPYACRMTVSGLTPNTTYYYFNRWAPDPLVQVEQGGIIFPESIGNWRRSTAPSLGSAANRDTLVTDATGSYTGWFISESNIATDFTPGAQLYFRLVLDVPGGTSPIRVTSTETVTVLAWDDYFDPVPTSVGTGVRSVNANPTWGPKNFIMLFDNQTGTGRPIAGTYVESDGVANSTANGYVSWYASATTGVNGFNNRWGTIIPDDLPNGIRRIAQYSFAAGTLLNGFVDTDGDWGGANGNTVNPTGGGANDPSAVRVIDGGAPIPLPVMLISFTASVGSDSKATLQWRTASETSFSHFIVEASKDAGHYTEKGRKDSKGDNSTYSLVDVLTPGITYYRLKMVDIDGRYSYSEVIVVNSDLASLKLSVFPNPAQHNLIATHTKGKSGATLVVTGMTGARMATQYVQKGAVQTTVDISRLPAGNYILVYYNENEKQHIKFSKQ